MTALTVRLSDDATQRLDALAQKLDVSSDAVVLQAIEGFLAQQTWQIEEIEAGIAEIESGEFANPQDVQDLLIRYAQKGA